MTTWGSSLARNARRLLFDMIRPLASPDGEGSRMKVSKTASRRAEAVREKPHAAQGQARATEIHPDGDEQYRLTIPKIEAHFDPNEDTDFTGVEPSYQLFEDPDARLRRLFETYGLSPSPAAVKAYLDVVAADPAPQWEREYARTLEAKYERIHDESELANFVAQVVVAEIGEAHRRRQAALRDIVQHYVDSVRVADGESRQHVLFRNRGRIAADILKQIRRKIAEKASYVDTGEFVQFRSYRVSSSSEKHKDTVDALSRRRPLRGRTSVERALDRLDRGIERGLAAGEWEHTIVTGYRKTVFPKNVFDSWPEKRLADILDADVHVARWVRVPKRQMPIVYDGTRKTYTPDFVVETKRGRCYLVELKSGLNLGELDVQAKARAAVAWCKVASEGTGKVWEYKLIPNDVIERKRTFQGVLSGAVVSW